MKACSTQQHTWKLGQLVGKSAGIIIKRLRVRIPAGTAGEFSSPELTLNADSYSVSILTHVIAVACKRPWSFCQKCRWQVMPKHAHTLDPTKSEWAEYAAVQAQCGNLSSGNKLTRNLSGNIQPQSSQLTDPLCTDPGIKSGIGVCKLVSTSKKKKRCSWGMNGRTFSQNPRQRGKSHYCHHHVQSTFFSSIHAQHGRKMQHLPCAPSGNFWQCHFLFFLSLHSEH